MRSRRLAALALVTLIFLAACSEAPVPGAAPGPTSIPTLDDACKTAETFLKGWEAGDYAGMYALLSPKSQQLSQTTFSAAYEQADNEMVTPGKSHTLDCSNVKQQGTTAVVTYDMTFTGSIFGEFTDPARTMRLVLSPRGWRVAWSTMDIFEGMAGGATLNLTYTPALRGTIYDRNGKVLAADNQVLFSAKLLTRVYPGKPDDCFVAIARVFKRRLVEVQVAYKGSTGLDYGYVVGHLDTDEYNAHKGELEQVCKIQWSSYTTRVYAGNGLAAQSMGYIGQIPADQREKYLGYPNGALVGLEGIEQKYEKELSGTPGAELTIRAPGSTLIRTIAKQESKPSQSVKLTLDRDLQLATEQAISDAYNYAQPSWGQFSTGTAAVVMKVDTGEILSIASYPTFDVDVFNPNTSFNPEKMIPAIVNPPNPERSAIRNRVTGEYSALASVMKIISMVAAADSGTFKLTDRYTCEGKWYGQKFGDAKEFRWDWIGTDPYFKDKGNRHGDITLVQALTASCDAYFFEVGGTLNQKDPALLSTYALRMGLGKPTGITDLGELPGQIPSPANIAQLSETEGRKWSVADTLNVVIGQGDVKVTPLQVARMMGAVANGGTFYKPYMVASVGSDTQITYQAQPEAQGTLGDDKPIDKKVMDGVRQGLCGVTMDAELGTAHWFLKNWNFNKIMLCGKTGTAQTGFAQPNGWFVAYAGPTGRAPEIVVAVLVERGREGSETAGPIVRRIVESYYKIPYNDYPDFWSAPYDPLVDPNSVSDGGRH